MTMIQDTEALCEKFGLEPNELTRQALRFRLSMLAEEVDETHSAYADCDPEEFVDGLIDVVVVALLTLEMAGVNIQQAWDEVFLANITKVVGKKPGRDAPDGLDLTKPEGWTPPDHSSNIGVLADVL